MLARAGAPLLVVAILTAGARAAAAPDSPPDPGAGAGIDAAATPAEAAFPEAPFGPHYVIEEVRVTGNRKTQTSLIVGELAVLGLSPGASVDASDARVEMARYRLLSLGYFLDVHLSVIRGSKRGAVVLVVAVEERGTLVINELFPATSEATLFWGGADVSEMNFLGRGINLGAGFVASTKPVVPGAHAGLGLRLHVGVPPLGGPDGVGLSVTGLYNDGSEFYRASGDDSDPDPGRFVATRVKRAGGVLTAGKMFPHNLHATASFREEWVDATLPSLQTQTLPNGSPGPPIDFMINPGSSRVGTGAVGLDYDTRSDPVLPRSGMRTALSVEVGTAAFGSSYGFVKTVFNGSFYARMPRGALGFHLFAGAIDGVAPYFDRFFVGDLDLLLPRRALGINFSTQPAPSFLLHSSIAAERYDNYAGRLLVEYAVPVWRHKGLVYGGDAFVAAGLFAMANDEDTLSSPSVGLTGDLGLRLDTYVGVFTVSIANVLSRSSF
ncbi:MAG TPA: BamA/TamA family outer membrane protein [Polyangia bacterium]|nr:BamA/TamA family outer membrane protein [Polyangia bacterium]